MTRFFTSRSVQSLGTFVDLVDSGVLERDQCGTFPPTQVAYVLEITLPSGMRPVPALASKNAERPWTDDLNALP